MGPGQIENAISEVAVAVFVDQVQAPAAAVADTAYQVDDGALASLQDEAAAYRHDGVEHGADRPRELLDVHGRRLRQVASATDESGAVGLVGNRFDVNAMGGQQMA